MDALTMLLDRYGLPTATVVFVLWWVAKRLLEPLVTRHGQYLDETAAAITSLSTAYQMLAAAYTRQNAIIERLLCLVPPTDPFDAPIHPDRQPFHEPRS